MLYLFKVFCESSEALKHRDKKSSVKNTILDRKFCKELLMRNQSAAVIFIYIILMKSSGLCDN